MPRPVDLTRIRTMAATGLSRALERYDAAVSKNLDYPLLRWIAKMTAVEVHAVWERYAEQRLVAALNHSPEHFLNEYSIRGVTQIPFGLASYAVRGGGRYFDFRSMSDLIDRGDRLVGQATNPFRTIPKNDRSYLDTLSSIRNRIVHQSEASIEAYKRSLLAVYGTKSAPGPDEFLRAMDYRRSSPERYKSRLHGLSTVVGKTIQHT